jgi:small subunit ribosomal protein S20
LANIKSQKKRNITNEKARLANKAVRSELKTLAKKADEAVESGDRAAAEAAMLEASRRYDKAVSSGVIPKNRAANHKSRMARRVDAMGA